MSFISLLALPLLFYSYLLPPSCISCHLSSPHTLRTTSNFVPRRQSLSLLLKGNVSGTNTSKMLCLKGRGSRLLTLEKVNTRSNPLVSGALNHSLLSCHWDGLKNATVWAKRAHCIWVIGGLSSSLRWIGSYLRVFEKDIEPCELMCIGFKHCIQFTTPMKINREVVSPLWSKEEMLGGQGCGWMRSTSDFHAEDWILQHFTICLFVKHYLLSFWPLATIWRSFYLVHKDAHVTWYTVLPVVSHYSTDLQVVETHREQRQWRSLQHSNDVGSTQTLSL